MEGDQKAMTSRNEKTISFKNFTGLNENYEDYIGKSEFSVLRNFDFAKEGVRGIIPRQGNEIYDASFLATSKIVTLENIPASSEFQIAQVDQTLYKSDFVELGGAGNGSCNTDIQSMSYFLNKVFIFPGLTDGGSTKGIIYDISTGAISLQSDGPDNGKYCILYKNRLWVAVGNYVYYSAAYMFDNDGDADDWDISNNFIKIAPDSGHDIVSLIPTQNALLVCLENGDVYPIYGAYTNEFQIPQFPISDKGPISHRTVKRYRSATLWLGEDDVYKYEGGNILPVSEKRQLYTQFKNVSTDQAIRNVAVASTIDDDYIICFRQKTSGVPNKCYVFNIVYGTWREYENYKFYFQASCVTTDKVWITGQCEADTDGKYKLLKQRTSFADTYTTNGDTNIIADATTHETMPSDGFMDVQFKKLFARLAYGSVTPFQITLKARTGLRDIPRDNERFKLFEFLKAASTVGTETDTTVLWDENNWANDDEVIDPGELVWAEDGNDSRSIYSLQNEYRTFNLMGNSLKLSFTVSYTTDPEVELERIKIHYLQKRRVL